MIGHLKGRRVRDRDRGRMAPTFYPFEVNVPHLAYAFLGGFVVLVSGRELDAAFLVALKVELARHSLLIVLIGFEV